MGTEDQQDICFGSSHKSSLIKIMLEKNHMVDMMPKGTRIEKYLPMFQRHSVDHCSASELSKQYKK